MNPARAFEDKNGIYHARKCQISESKIYMISTLQVVLENWNYNCRHNMDVELF
jgi:hypothetical protein